VKPPDFILRTNDAAIPIDAIQSDPTEVNNRTHGSQLRVDLQVSALDVLIVSDDNTHTVAEDTTEIYTDVIVESNGILNVDGELIVYGNVTNNGTINISATGTLTITDKAVEPFADIVAFDRHAGSYSINNTLNNQQRYRERLPANPNISSLVVGIEPNKSIQTEDITGVWGLIGNISDARNRPLSDSLIRVEIDILAAFAEYSDVTNVKTNLEV